MAKRMDLGPVFWAEWLVVSRGWQWYMARSVLLSVLLGAMALVWWVRWVNNAVQSIHDQAEIGRLFCNAINACELAMVLLAAPAATAGAICLDRARGTLTHMLVTDLTAAEIVLGKLAARLVPVLALLFCVLPILAIGTMLGGIDLWVVGGASLVTLGVALSGCAGALALSTWGSKTHEVLLSTYAVWAFWLLSLPMWYGCRLLFGGVIAPPTWFAKANPVWLVAAPTLRPGTVEMGDLFAFFGASILAAVVLVAIAANRLRGAEGRQDSRKRFEPRMLALWDIPDRLKRVLPGPSLDANPVLWREWHRRRTSSWARAVWSLYGALAISLSVILIVSASTSQSANRRNAACVANGFQAGIGLLLLSISAATSLAEERARGDLDVLLTTTLSTGSIVWGKWWGTFRVVPLLAVCPGAVAFALARDSGRWDGASLLVCLFVGYCAAITSLGLALATWIRRLDHAIALNVAVLAGVTVGWLYAVELTIRGPFANLIAAGSPIMGIVFPTVAMHILTPTEWKLLVMGWAVWIAVYMLITASLYWATLMTFDRCLGRISETRK